MKKRIVSMLLALTMVCSMAACGNGGSGSAGASTSKAEKH